jgi:small subunit ribosomal protein S16
LVLVGGDAGVSTVPSHGGHCDRRPDLLALSVSWCGGTLKIKGNIMVVIRLARGGSKKRPFYNIVVANSQQRRDGRFIEKVGFYNPVASGAAESLRVATDRVAYWTGVGAQLSPTVARLVDQAKKAVVAA